MKNFYVGQIPAEEIVFKTLDERKLPRQIVGLYQSAKVLIRRPDGSVYSDGSAFLYANPFHGVSYRFGNVSPFTMPGEYVIQIKLSRGSGQFDYTDPIAIDVFEAIQ
ncbi:hypothetical protein ACFVWF_19430 [Rhodococcus qingshengii]|uniref:hypothetical protein n=1 Tax=Rhodococcus qingshengii TaxID=334542 RepID=UPI0036D9B0CD